MQRRLVGLVFALVAVASACRRGAADAPPCAAVGAKFYRLAADALEKSQLGARTDAAMRRAVLDQIPAMRDSIVAVCTESKWAPQVRACLVDANDPLAFEACQQQLTDDQRRALERQARGESTTGASK